MTHIKDPPFGYRLVAELCRGKCNYDTAAAHCVDCEHLVSLSISRRPGST